jgi:hypothetical protein
VSVRLFRDGDLEAARPESEAKQLVHLRAALADEIETGDPAVDDAVLNVFGHVGGADEQYLDRRVPAGKGECAVARLLRAEASVLEQAKRRLSQPALDRNGDSQVGARSSASR